MKGLIAILGISILVSSCGPRRPGKVGETGQKGSDGFSLVTDVVSLTSGGVNCKRTDIFMDLDRNKFYSVGDLYQNGFLVCDGAVGNDGAQGIQGEIGEQGEQGETGQAGANGLNGLDADTTYQVVAIVDPCGQQNPNGQDEVLLKLGNGKYLASFSDNSNGLNTRLGLLPNGNYVTTDGTSCHFSIPYTI